MGEPVPACHSVLPLLVFESEHIAVAIASERQP